MSLNESFILSWLIVRWNSSSAVLFKSEVVLVHLDSEESSLSPVSSPRVSDDPVLLLSGLVYSPSKD